MQYFVENIKNNNSTIILYFLSEILAIITIIIAITHAFNILNNLDKFQKSNFYVALFISISFIMRIPYMIDKPLGFIFMILNAIGWSFVTLIYFIAYKKLKN